MQHLPDTLYQLVGTHTLGHVDGVESSEQLCSCRFCSRYFSTHVLCRAHESMQHQQRSDPTAGPAFCRYTHGLDGMPTCRLCRHPFRKWGSFANTLPAPVPGSYGTSQPLAVPAPPGLDLPASSSNSVPAQQDTVVTVCASSATPCRPVSQSAHLPSVQDYPLTGRT